jgi:hypothetical protein
MRQHILLERAFVYNQSHKLTKPKGYVYDDVRGAWVNSGTVELMVESKDTERPKPRTKKADIETGEDQKGE